MVAELELYERLLCLYKVENYKVLKWARGGIGIRARFRSVFREDWEFKSPRAH